MKFQRSTLLLLCAALLLSGLVFATEFSGKPQREAQQAQQQQIFAFKEADVNSITVTTSSQVVELAKVTPETTPPPPKPTADQANDQAKPPTPPAQPSAQLPAQRWLLQRPNAMPANDATVAYLLSLLTTSKHDRTLTVPTSQLPELGLEPPIATVDLTLTNTKSQRLVVGKPDFSNRFLYARANPASQPASQVEVLLIPIDLQNAIDRPLEDWKQPAPSADTPDTSN